MGKLVWLTAGHKKSLVFCAIFFAVVTVLCGYQVNRAGSMFSKSYIATAWPLIRLYNELDKLESALIKLHAGQGTVRQVELRYDVVWSRLENIRVKGKTSMLKDVSGALPVFSEVFSKIQSVESSIMRLEQLTSAERARLIEQVQYAFDQYSDFFNVNFHSDHGYFNKVNRNLQEALTMLAGVMVLMMLVGSYFLFMFVRELRANRHHALHDSLTSLANRHQLRIQLEQRCSYGKPPFAMMILDLNGFKEVNDTLGHNAGDVLLCDVAKRLKKAIGTQGFIARMGGDEFAVMSMPLINERHISSLAKLIEQAFYQHFSVEGQLRKVDCSIGIACFPEHGKSVRELLTYADMAMYEAKKRKVPNQSGHCVYDPEVNYQIEFKKRVFQRLQQAIEQRQMQVHYRPKFDLVTGAVAGFSSQISWRERVRDGASDSVVKLAEQTGLSHMLFEFHLEACIGEVKQLQSKGVVDLPFSLPCTPKLDQRLVDILRKNLSKYRFRSCSIILEVEDRSLAQLLPEQAERIFTELTEMGVKVALVNFSQGEFPLGLLTRLPIHSVKLAPELLQRAINTPADRSLLQSLTQLCHGLDIDVCGTGVNSQQAELVVARAGCDFCEGDWCCAQVDAARISQLLGCVIDVGRRDAGRSLKISR